MFITLGIMIWEVPLPNPRTKSVDGVLWLPEGKELYSEYQMQLEVDVGEVLIAWRIRPDVREGKGTAVVLSGTMFRKLVSNLKVLRLYEREVKGGVLREQSPLIAPSSRRKQ